MTPVRAVFLDRDGVLCRAIVRDGRPYAPTSMAEFEILDGVAAALERLHAARYRLVVVTNQPDVARGVVAKAEVERMHAALMADLPIDSVKVCYEEDGPSCTCYKPKPGMLLEAASEFDLDLTMSFIVGDRWRDIGAGRNADCGTIFIDRGYSEALVYRADHVCQDLPAAADYILSQGL